MTSQAPTPASVYLNTVCPGIHHLDYNSFYLTRNKQHGDDYAVDWPFADEDSQQGGAPMTSGKTANLTPSYLNIARPPLNSTVESTTYLSLPHHVTSSFRQLLDAKGGHLDAGLQIGANVNSLAHDAFRLVHLNPGCLTTIINNLCSISLPNDYSEATEFNTSANSNKNPFHKLTNNFSKILKVTSTSLNLSTERTDLLNLNSPNSFVHKILDYDPSTYSEQILSPSIKKFLVSVNINVLNVIGIDANGNYVNVQDVQDRSWLTIEDRSESHDKTPPEPVNKTIDRPLLRLQLNPHSVVTSLKAVSMHGRHVVVLGLDNGTVAYIDLTDLRYVTFSEFEPSAGPDNASVSSTFSHTGAEVAITSLDIMSHPRYPFLVLAGLANGEVVIIDPHCSIEDRKQKYTKEVVGQDHFATYFKKFDLSLTGSPHTPNHTGYIVGHFKISHKPITCIKTTLPYGLDYESLGPMIMAIGSDDGLVKFLDLNFTYEQNYGESDDPTKNTLVTDVISNYFNEGISSIDFSPDGKFVCIAGTGDLVEVFKMCYYNVNGLIARQGDRRSPSPLPIYGGKRSRSGTLNSTSSANHNWLSPSATSVELHPYELDMPQYPPILKDIKITVRFKGHVNKIHRVSFVPCKNSTTYKLISCGFDGMVIIWEFDYRALPKVKRPRSAPVKKTQSSGMSEPSTKAPAPAKSNVTPRLPSGVIHSLHTRSRSGAEEALTSTLSINSTTFNNLNNSLNNMNNGPLNNIKSVLGSSNKPETKTVKNQDEQVKIVNALYRSLFDLRLRKYNARYGVKRKSILHAIINDKFVPFVEISLLKLDMSRWYSDGKVEGTHFDHNNFWVFGKNGDILRYSPST